MKNVWDRQTRQKLAVPCRCFEILTGKCGFIGQRSDTVNGSNRGPNGNAKWILT
jgi:hypothetical protein